MSLVHKTGAANKSDNDHTAINVRMQLVLVQMDLAFNGKTMTMNLCEEKSVKMVA